MLVANICFAHLHTNAIVITIHGLHYVTAIVSIFVTLNLFINKCFSFVGEEARGDNFTNMRYRFQKSHLVSRRGSDTYLSPNLSKMSSPSAILELSQQTRSRVDEYQRPRGNPRGSSSLARSAPLRLAGFCFLH